MEHSATSSIAIPYLFEFVAFLLSVVVIVPVFKRLKLSPILGFLAVGAIIGPHALKLVSDAESVRHVAELGVIFLLFAIGLELSFERLKAFSRLIFGLGAAQVLVTAAVISSVAFYWGNSADASIIIGLCLALSSTAVVMQILTERGEINSRAGRTAFAVLLFQDLAVVPILILLSIFGSESDGNIWLNVGIAVGKAVLSVAAIIIVGRYVLRYLFRTATNTRSVDVFTAMMLLTILATSIATGLAGLSMALGAFLAGLLLAETEFRHQIESEIEPFKGLLLGLFFMSVGMSLDFGMAFKHGIWVVLSVLGLIGLKALIATICGKLFGLKTSTALRSGLILSEAGEFAFVVIGQATLTYNLISIEVGQFMVVVAGISMACTPALASLGKWVAEKIEPAQNEADLETADNNHLSGHVVIAGFGRVGHAVASVLKAEAVPYIALDTDAAAVQKHRNSGEPVFVGAANKAELLRRSGIEQATAVLITMDNYEAALSTVEIIRDNWPALPVLVRSRDARHSDALIAAGATTVIPETLEASLQLSERVLVTLGYAKQDAHACIDLIRSHGYVEVSPAPEQTN